MYGAASAPALFTRQDQGGTDGRTKCAYCLGEHSHEDCMKITDVNERKRLIRKFTCLKKGHIS